MDKNNLINEVKRFKKLSGLMEDVYGRLPLNWTALLLGALDNVTFTDDVINDFTNKVGLTFDNVTKKISNIDWATISETDLFNLMKRVPDFAKQVEDTVFKQNSLDINKMALTSTSPSIKKIANALKKTKSNPLAFPNQPAIRPTETTVTAASVDDIIQANLDNDLFVRLHGMVESLYSKGKLSEDVRESIYRSADRYFDMSQDDLFIEAKKIRAKINPNLVDRFKSFFDWTAKADKGKMKRSQSTIYYLVGSLILLTLAIQFGEKAWDWIQWVKSKIPSPPQEFGGEQENTGSGVETDDEEY